MIKIKDLTIKNFLSIGNKTESVNFDRQDLTLILGENLDLGGDGAKNGVGKSAMMNALNYALYGQAMNNIRVNNLINKTNAKNMLVSVDFEAKGKEYRIERGRKPNILRFFENDVETLHEDNARGESKETQKDISQILGMSHDMFKHTVSLNTSTIPFLKMRANDQKNIIEQLLGITVLTEKADILKENFKTSKNKIEHEELHIQAITDANTHIETQIKKLVTRQAVWKKGITAKITEQENGIADLSTLDINDELLQHKLLNEYNEKQVLVDDAEKWIKKYNLDIDTVNRMIVKNNTDIKAAERNIDKAKNNITVSTNNINIQKNNTIDDKSKADIKKIQDKIKKNNKNKLICEKQIQRTTSNIEQNITKLNTVDNETHECPTCNQKCDAEHSKNIVNNIKKRLNKSIKQDQAVLDRENKAIADLETENTDYLDDIVDVKNTANTHISTSGEKIVELQNRILDYDNDIIACKDLIITYNKEIDDNNIDKNAIHDDLYEAKLVLADVGNIGEKPDTFYNDLEDAHNHKNTLDTLTSTLNELKGTLDPYSEQITEMRADGIVNVDYDELNRLVEMKEHQAFLLKLLTSKDSFIRRKIIEQNLNYLNNRLTHYLNEIGLPHDVKFMSDLSVEISEMGRELDEGNLSRGENTRLILALSLAFRDVHESMYGNLNLIFIDELLDSGLDAIGVESAVKILKRMTRERHKSIWLISHREELTSRVGNIFTVRKSEGFTSFKNE